VPLLTVPQWNWSRVFDSTQLSNLNNGFSVIPWGSALISIAGVGDNITEGLSTDHPYWSFPSSLEPVLVLLDSTAVPQQDTGGFISLRPLETFFVHAQGTTYLYNLEAQTVQLNSASGEIDLAPVWSDVLVGSPFLLTYADTSTSTHDYVEAYSASGRFVTPYIGPVSVTYRSSLREAQILNGTLALEVDGSLIIPRRDEPETNWEQISKLYLDTIPEEIDKLLVKRSSQKVAFSGSFPQRIASALDITSIRKWGGTLLTGTADELTVEYYGRYVTRRYTASQDQESIQMHGTPILVQFDAKGQKHLKPSYSIESNTLVLNSPLENSIVITALFQQRDNTLEIEDKIPYPQVTVYGDNPSISYDEQPLVQFKWGTRTLTTSSALFF